MSSKQQSHGRKGRDNRKSARKGKENQPMNQLLSNDNSGNTKVELDAPKDELAPKNELTPKKNVLSPTFWFLAEVFMLQANEEDVKWLDNLINDAENNVDSGVEKTLRAANYEPDKNEINVRQMLESKLSTNNTLELNSSELPNPNGHGIYVLEDDLGRKIIISRENLEKVVYKHSDDIFNWPSCPTECTNQTGYTDQTGHTDQTGQTDQTGHTDQTEHILPDLPADNKVDYKFIVGLIEHDDSLSHLKGKSKMQINELIIYCRSHNCLEMAKGKLERRDKTILKCKKRGNFSLKRERRIASYYALYQDLATIMERFDTFVVEKKHPVFK